MKLVVSQPMYLPWAGLFDQIRHADVFIHYDDVQLPQGRSFSSRVQLKTNSNISWLTVPIIKETRKIINTVKIDHSKNWQQKHLNKIIQSMSQAPFFNDVLNLLQSSFSKKHILLADLNIDLIENIASYLNLNVSFFRSSELNNINNSSQRLLDICTAYNAHEYITGHGAKNYLEHKLFDQNNILISYMDYKITPYPQEGVFTPYVTILNLIAQNGKSSINNLQSTLIPWKDYIIR